MGGGEQQLFSSLSHSYEFLFAEINLFVPAVSLYDVLLSAQTESFSKLFVFGLSCLTSFLCSFFCFLCLLLLFCCFVAFFVSWHYGFGVGKAKEEVFKGALNTNLGREMQGWDMIVGLWRRLWEDELLTYLNLPIPTNSLSE
jgi:hypothetical protein